ncbi:MAG: hypothetical protein HDR17_00415 [Lachnospiraceae bacterium]|nr:hypothetical protein [Lachnospiraceae bacterium]
MGDFGIRAIQATASLISIGIWSKVKCEPKNKPWVFDESAWGWEWAAAIVSEFMSGAGAFEIGGSCKWKSKPDKK